MNKDLSALKDIIGKHIFIDENVVISDILHNMHFDFRSKERIKQNAQLLIKNIQCNKEFTIEQLLKTYNLSTDEGVAIMCLAESLSRIQDNDTAFEFLLDKLSNKEWASHFFNANSSLLRFTSIGLTISGKWSDICDSDQFFGKLSSKFSKEIFLHIIKQVIAWIGENFIVGQTISETIKNISSSIKKGYSFSFDLLGESSRTFEQANQYYERYIEAIKIVGKKIHDKSISIKLTALYPRLEQAKISDVDSVLVPKLIKLLDQAAQNDIAITFDAEESYRLSIYLHVVTSVITHPNLNHAKIGVVVQAYQKCSSKVIDYIIGLSQTTNKQIPIRLVKGAYWDTEIKHAQVHGLSDYPVFTKKEFTDINYIYCAKKILDHSNDIYPQFATHNAITAATIIELAQGKTFEFQKLQGMGDVLHKSLIKNHKIRIYAPVGRMDDLLAYLMRRLLENSANTSFVHQVSDIDVKDIKCDIHHIANKITKNTLTKPQNIYVNRINSEGYDIGYQIMYDEINSKLHKFSNKIYKIGPIINGKHIYGNKHTTEHFLPAHFAEKIGDISVATESDMLKAISSAKDGFTEWSKQDVSHRASVLRRIGDLYQENKDELYSLLIREGGKSITDAINEVREAIDFCRYYALLAEEMMIEKILPGPTGEKNLMTLHARGIFLCISPWNFPLAIFTGQIVAALVTGNTVIAKPAEQTPIIANFAIQLMHKASVPQNVLHLLIASGSQIGKYIVPHPDIAGVVFTGSNDTAKLINCTLAQRSGGIIPIIAETGGQNAMIVDSSALLEQVTDDVITSAFYSAGQRCSALRVLYIQEEIYDSLTKMIIGALNTTKIGDTRDLQNDIGPVIDKKSQETLANHITDMQNKGFRILATHHQKDHAQLNGYYFYPHIIEISSINDIPDERFGPILHVIKYKNTEIDNVINEINDYGYGLTFGVHSRIERRIDDIRSKIKVGNIYVNRSIVGAQVESQPFGGENKSGTGFKAGGPNYLMKFIVERTTSINLTAIGGNIELLK